MLKAAEGADRLPTGILALPRSGTETLPAQIIGIVDPLSVPSQGPFLDPTAAPNGASGHRITRRCRSCCGNTPKSRRTS